jgi:hypothetical protein
MRTHLIPAAISHVLCRCTGYQQIVDAIEETAQQRLVAPAGGQRFIAPAGGSLPQSYRNLEGGMAEFKYIGKRSCPKDGFEKVTGKARPYRAYELPRWPTPSLEFP